MAQFDRNADTTPQMLNKRADTKPTVSALRTAIEGSGVAASYPTAVLETATKDDLVYICKTHNISVVGL